MEKNEDYIQPQTDKTPVHQHKPNKLPVVALSTLLLMSITTSVYFYFQNQSLRQELIEKRTAPDMALSSPTPAPSAPLTLFTDKYEFGTKIEQEFNKIVYDYKGQIITDSKASVWWISNDNFNIINNNETGLDYQNYSCESDFKNKEVFSSITNKLSENIKSVMTSSGFIFNQKNSSKSVIDDQFLVYVQAYEKGNTKCTFTASPDCGTYSDTVPMHYDFSFACTDSFNNNYQEQIPFLKGLNITDAIVHIDKRIGDYAKVNVNYRGSGHYAIAQLINGVWTKLYSGQDIPDCKTMVDHQVPQEIYGNCFPLEGN